MTTPPPPQGSNRAAYVLHLPNISEVDRRLIKAYLRCQRDFTKAAEAEGTTRQRVSRAWKRWESAIIDAI